jgi:preprotein translocase subunit SecG
MTTLFVILVILASVILGLIVLVQNPKGGGSCGNIAGFSNQFMGVKQTTDVLEKGTWIFAGVIGVLCLLSYFIYFRKSSSGTGASQKVSSTPINTTPPVNASGLSTNPTQQQQANPTTTAQKSTN